MVMRLKFGSSSISMKQVIITSIFIRILINKTNFIEGSPWFKCSVAKALKIRARKFWWLICTLVEVTGEKLVGKLFAASS